MVFGDLQGPSVSGLQDKIVYYNKIIYLIYSFNPDKEVPLTPKCVMHLQPS